MNVQTRIYQPMATKLQPKQDIEAVLAAKAWDDPKFKQELLSNPKEVLAREVVGFNQLPENINIKVIEEQPDTMYFVLPANPIPAIRKLSDEELEVVAGGLSECCVSISACCETGHTHWTWCPP